ncbi:hypothetical protein FF38_02804 [Lucilia cuprina]|uniref:Uncharacterized protein n=1 Tax=Lucilia cuprina TaxID=7375 RepID=A0A0L0CE38_LUCCU|nr:hypothetical protein FF38_02804 [Lucilia cuprina]
MVLEETLDNSSVKDLMFTRHSKKFAAAAPPNRKSLIKNKVKRADETTQVAGWLASILVKNKEANENGKRPFGMKWCFTFYPRDKCSYTQTPAHICLYKKLTKIHTRKLLVFKRTGTVISYFAIVLVGCAVNGDEAKVYSMLLSVKRILYELNYFGLLATKVTSISTTI